MVNLNKILPSIHPSEILLEEFLEPMGISQYRLAKDINVPPRRINEIVLGKRSIMPDTALRLSPFFPLPALFLADATVAGANLSFCFGEGAHAGADRGDPAHDSDCRGLRFLLSQAGKMGASSRPGRKRRRSS